ncbi:MAG: formylglycine-generating enzyme family protein [Alphaproteobacteria bacterium]|nr:formylglycine-generating enzyme family protein [Alphaproteobacteria bacterium]
MLFLARVCSLLFAVFAVCAIAHAEEHKEREFQECVNCPTMVGVPAGSFVMGSGASEPGHFDNEGPVHTVNVRAFAIGKYDVTTEEFLRFLNATGYKPQPCNSILNMRWRRDESGQARPPVEVQPPRFPAVCLDWKDANAYVAWLNSEVKKARPAQAGKPGPYRLPTEAEWEYAARGGTTTARWWGAEIGVNNANCNGCGSKYDARVLADVDAFAANPFGLFGVLGNAWQWTADCWHPDYRGAPADGSAWTSGGDCTRHVLRGGSWDNTPVFVRAATRTGGPAVHGEYDYSGLAGFRVARTLP